MTLNSMKHNGNNERLLRSMSTASSSVEHLNSLRQNVFASCSFEYFSIGSAASTSNKLHVDLLSELRRLRLLARVGIIMLT